MGETNRNMQNDTHGILSFAIARLADTTAAAPPGGWRDMNVERYGIHGAEGAHPCLPA